MTKPVGVITSIYEPNSPVKAHSVNLLKAGGKLLVVGDLKTPENWHSPGVAYLGPKEQGCLGLALHEKLPFNHYARKNLGYITAMREGATCIYDTDDDNAPTNSWRVWPRDCESFPVRTSDSANGWINAYSLFTYTDVWPRGLPLDRIKDSSAISVLPVTKVRCGIRQGTADGEPDVDAIWRLVNHSSNPVTFNKSACSVHVGIGQWSPINSQATWWYPDAYELMYLPSFCSFRMTDIWRGFVAERILWDFESVVSFTAPSEVVQVRNPHRLMHDFADEVPGYLYNADICSLLASLSLTGTKGERLLQCYEALVKHEFISEAELPLVWAWIVDVQNSKHSP